MIVAGSLVEYIEGGRFLCALVAGVADRKIRLLNQNGREINLPESRILIASRTVHPQDASREELTAALLDMNRGITLLSGEGGYTHQARKVILCAFGKNQIIQLKKRVQQVDPDAFIIVYDANEVLGKGFGSYEAGGL